MSARDAGGSGRDLRAPSGIDAEYRRQGGRLLRRLGEPGMWAERRGDQIVLSREGTSVSLASGMPTGVLSLLLEEGALACARRGGRSVFAITEAGRARLRREAAEEDPFLSQHRVLETREIETPEGRMRVRINTREDPLDLFRSGRGMPGLVGPAEIEAGDRLARDFVLAQSLPQVTANWSRLAVDGAGYNPGLSPSERVAEARRRVDGAMRAVGPDFSGILLDICGFSKGIEALERERALPARSGKVVVALALRHLARHYGLGNIARGAEGRGIRQWGTPDHRPALRAG